MFEGAQERILVHMSPLLKELDFEIFEFTIERHGKTIALKMLVDHLQGGVNIDECSAINKELARLIEEEQLLAGDYTVEVSSPGLDRPLKTKKDFKRIIGKSVKFHLNENIENKKEHDGIIKDAGADMVIVQLKNQSISIPYVRIQKAVQII